CQQGYNTPYSF
nr:immunoglobulin light chain junction region [Macaca mulatta]MOW14098.1 immunoglobulin light chain junction region [Macaca mulatta]MOW33711.1 immunoglobulin light chain junction region [Macaca mulatta]MOW33810.1 immunoglobulin light chain junction region [Macaca mulatta]MOW33860.1 immunoglobulin light chain junction region [Macaca mulatta]